MAPASPVRHSRDVSPTVSENQLDYSLGRVLRSVRQRSGLTMATLAQLADISQPHLSQMENGKVSPSISTLYRLATALGVSPQELLPSTPTSDLVVIRAGESEATPISDRPNAALSRVLLGSPGRSLQVQEVVVTEGQDLGDWFEHEGEEFVYVLEGSVIIELRDNEARRLEAGDSAWYPSAVPHRWRVTGSFPLRVLAASAVTERVPPAPHGIPASTTVAHRPQ